MKNLLKILFFGLMTIQFASASEGPDKCSSGSCLFVEGYHLEMIKSVDELGNKSYVLNTNEPLLKFLGPDKFNYACYSGEHMKSLLQIIESLYKNGLKDIAGLNDNYEFEVLSYHGFTVAEGYDLNLVLKSKYSNRVHVYKQHISFCN